MSILLPAEWAPQSGVMLTWPHAHSDWGPILSDVEPAFIGIASAVTRFEQLLVSAFDATHQAHIESLFAQANIASDRYRIFIQPSNDTWARDHGPITVIENGQPRLLDFVFNGWGGKFDASLDTQINRGLLQQGAFANDCSMQTFDFVLEGGSLDSDGEGSLLTTSHCLLTPTRNPDYDRAKVETYLKQLFGLKRILWLNHGELAGDDTDSHIDMLARFCDANTIAYTSCDDEQDIHFEPLARMREELEQFTTLDGKPYKLVALPIPAAIYDDEQRLPASYANFLIINKAVLLPVYGDANDEVARSRLQAVFPEHEVITVNCRQVIRQYGSLHCLTMQLPADVLA